MVVPGARPGVRPILPRPPNTAPILVEVAPGPASGLRILNGSRAATQFLLVPSGALQPLQVPSIQTSGDGRAKRDSTQTVKDPVKLKLRKFAQEDSEPTAAPPEFLWSKESKMNLANRIGSDATTTFLGTMLQPEILSYIKKTELKKTFFIKVYEELTKKGFALNVRSPEEGGAKVWQKWRNLERVYLSKIERNGKNPKYPHYNFILIKKILDHLKKNDYKTRKAKTVKDNSNKNVEIKTSNKIIVLRSAAKSDFCTESDAYSEHDIDIDEDLNTYIKEESGSDPLEDVEDDHEYDDELLKQFECEMAVDEADVNVANGHEYVRCRIQSDEEEDTNPTSESDTLELNPSSFVSKETVANSTLHSSSCSAEVQQILNNWKDWFEQAMESRERMVKNMTELINQQRRFMEKEREERKKTNDLLEKILKMNCPE